MVSLQPVLAQPSGLTVTQPFAGTAQGSPLEAIRTVVNALLAIVSLIAAIAIIGAVVLAGGGDEDAGVTAKNTILYVILGLIVVGLSAVIVNFVISAIQAA